MKAIPSPCRNICALDPQQRFCTGCLRTLDEIALWPTATPVQRRDMMRILACRQRKLSQNDQV
ncbi:DUF1289 domain-containing protein [Croceicoccus sp. F390]|uniref:DUF1289 domain-containing protein n=1 Tax=Croceicoccus esteveae TaxID=3075597 RepID=A0ABU2ZHH5_9SPHN|nr:DUF1289 domain-containing protein [Croceicoccus sp. F390]MDT0575806.1 DUF1289 domain-containing protein [Croceicoccus sp. F390]